MGTGRWEVDFVYFFSSFPGGGSFFLICVMNKVVFENKKKVLFIRPVKK